MKSDLLKGLKVLDFSHRLPGPFAGYTLSQMGAEVSKIEDEKFQDAFLKGLFPSIDSSFLSWYEELNSSKKLLRFDFKSESTIKKIQQLVEGADALLLDLPPKVENFFGLDSESLKKNHQNLAVLKMGSSKENPQLALHDINAVALAGLLPTHIMNRKDDIIAPPFLPVSGIIFGHQAAMDLLALTRKDGLNFHTTYILETTKDLFGPFFPQKMRAEKWHQFLHNGAYPCYSLYRLKDGNYAALAAVEPRFWENFETCFQTGVAAEERFQSTPELFQKISKVLKGLSSSQVQERLGGLEACLSLVEL